MTPSHIRRSLFVPLLLLMAHAGAAWGEAVQVVIGALPQQYADFATAVAACNGKRMLIAQATPVHASVQVPISCELEFVAQGQLVIDDGVIVTIKGTIVAPLTTLFVPSGTTGKVVFATTANQDLYIQWWGATCNGVANDAPALNAMYAAMSTASQKLRLCAPSLLDTAATPVEFYINGANLYAPFGEIDLTGPIVFHAMSGCGIHGQGTGYLNHGSIFQWKGTEDPALNPGMFISENAICEFDGLIIAASGSTHHLLSGILLTKVISNEGANSQTPRQTIIRDVFIYGNVDEIHIPVRVIGAVCLFGAHANWGGICAGGINNGLVCSGNSDCPSSSCTPITLDAQCPGGKVTLGSDNDETILEHDRFSNYSGAGFSIEMSQAMGNRLYDVSFRANAGGALCAVATGAGACTSGDATRIGHFCTEDLDCTLNGAGGGKCTRPFNPGGAFSWIGGFAGGHQKAVACKAGQSSNEPVGIQSISAEDNVTLWWAAGPSGGPLGEVTFDRVRFDANVSNPATAGNCTGLRTATVGGVTTQRPCCTGIGTGPDCLRTINHQTGGVPIITNSVLDNGDPAFGAYNLTLNSANGSPTTGIFWGSTLYSTAAVPFVAAHTATEVWETIGSRLSNAGSDVRINDSFGPTAGLVLTGNLTLPAVAFASLGTAVGFANQAKICIGCTVGTTPCTAGSSRVLAISDNVNWNCQ